MGCKEKKAVPGILAGQGKEEIYIDGKFKNKKKIYKIYFGIIIVVENLM